MSILLKMQYQAQNTLTFELAYDIIDLENSKIANFEFCSSELILVFVMNKQFCV